MKTKEKEIAIYYRSKGCSIREIANKIGCSKSSVSIWVQDVELTNNQKIELEKRNPMGKKDLKPHPNLIAYRTKISIDAREKRKQFQQEGRNLTKNTNNSLLVSGCMLYWAEGSKQRNSVKFTNTDLNMMLFFKKFLKECFFVNDSRITLMCRSHILSSKSHEECDEFWLGKLSLPLSSLRKGTIETRIPKVKNIKQEFGICTISVHSTEIVQKIFGAIKEIAKIDSVDLWL
jgi:transposase